MKIVKLLPIALFLILVGCLDTSSPSYDDTDDLAYLEEYAQEEGVTTTSSGLMYKVIEEGEGEMPASDQHTIIKYEGISVDGVHEYQTDPEEGLGFQIIVPDDFVRFSGIAEGVQLMKEGARYEFVMPSELAQEDGRAFTFDLTLDSFLREDQEQFLVDNAELEDIEETSSGLQYRIIEQGDGDNPTPTNTVKVKYKGTYTNGYVFDQSPNDESVELGVSDVIPGFSEGLQFMNEGGKHEFFIPPELGYGVNPPQFGTVLHFEVELVEVL